MLTVTLPILVGIHLIFAVVTIRHSNQDSVKSDQGAEMWLAATSRDDMFPQRTDGVRHPLWSWMARHLYTEDAEAFFVRGKGLNTALCLGFLCLLGIAVTRWLDPLATINLLTLISLGILLVRGTYFQPEPLYYILSFLSGVFAWRLLRGSAFWTYPVFGGVCALAFLSKPSLLPFLLSFGSAFGLRAILSGLRREEGWPVGKNVLGLLTALAVFAVMLIPLGRFSADAFGTPFFNYTKMWMWMDDFHNEAWPFQKKFPGRVQLETLTADEIPSVTSYFQRHTFGEAWVRGWSGSNEVATRFLFPEPKLKASAVFWRESGKKWSQPLAQRGIYLCGLALLCIGLAWPVRRTLASRLAESGNLAFAVFLLVGGGLYLGLYGWYFPIGRGDRFMGGLWIPLVFLLFWWAYALRRMGDRKGGDAAYLGIHAVIFLSLLLQIVGIFWRFQHGFYLTTRN
jgi:hypothetical protein